MKEKLILFALRLSYKAILVADKMQAPAVVAALDAIIRKLENVLDVVSPL